jgi:hypothetical protein
LRVSVRGAISPLLRGRPGPRRLSAVTYDLDLSTVGKGREVVRIVREGGATRLTSRLEIATPQGPMILTQDANLAGTPAEIVHYALTIEPPGVKAKGEMQATRKETGWTLEASAPGEGEPDTKQSKDLPVTGRSVFSTTSCPRRWTCSCVASTSHRTPRRRSQPSCLRRWWLLP